MTAAVNQHPINADAADEVIQRMKNQDEHVALSRRLDLEDHQDPARRHIFQSDARSRERAMLHEELSAKQQQRLREMRERKAGENK